MKVLKCFNYAVSPKLLRINMDTLVDSEAKHNASIFAAGIMYLVDFQLFCRC